MADPAGDSSWPAPGLLREAVPSPSLPHHQPVVRPGLPDAPCADSCPPGCPWLEGGGGPYSTLDLIRPCWCPAAWTWAGPRPSRHDSGPPHPLSALVGQGVHELMGAPGGAGQGRTGRAAAQEGMRPTAWLGCPRGACPAAPCPAGQGWAWAIFSFQVGPRCSSWYPTFLPYSPAWHTGHVPSTKAHTCGHTHTQEHSCNCTSTHTIVNVQCVHMSMYPHLCTETCSLHLRSRRHTNCYSRVYKHVHTHLPQARRCTQRPAHKAHPGVHFGRHQLAEGHSVT